MLGGVWERGQVCSKGYVLVCLHASLCQRFCQYKPLVVYLRSETAYPIPFHLVYKSQELVAVWWESVLSLMQFQ